MANALIPEFAVSDWEASKEFYMDILGFQLCYERPEEGFAFLALGKAELMIDQIGMGRTFDDGHLPDQKPFGRGLNVQIEVEITRSNSGALGIPLDQFVLAGRGKVVSEPTWVLRPQAMCCGRPGWLSASPVRGSRSEEHGALNVLQS